MSNTRERHERYLAERHRPPHGRRTAERWAGFLRPHLRPDMRLMDLGCGPGSITVGLGTRSIGVELHPVAVPGVPVVGADGGCVTGGVVRTVEAVAATARFEGTWFEAPEVVEFVTELGLSDTEEMAAVAAAWRRWAADPGACSTTLWFTALAWVP